MGANINASGQVWRWVSNGRFSCIVHEKDGDFVRTMCGQILRKEEVTHASLRAMRHSQCSKCSLIVTRGQQYVDRG